ncbi:unnamed protein product, partial [Medioppia subpectinata]
MFKIYLIANMYRLNTLFTKYSKSVPLVASIPAIIAGNDWYEYIRHNNTTKSHTNSSFKLSLTLRSAHLEDTATADHMSQVYERVLPSVVKVFLKEGNGSGSLVDDSGLIVTNAHVTEDWPRVMIHLSESMPKSVLFGEDDYNTGDDDDDDPYKYFADTEDEYTDELPGHVIYCDKTLDLAVVRVFTAPNAIPALTVVDRDLQPGEPVMPIGMGGSVPFCCSFGEVQFVGMSTDRGAVNVPQLQHNAISIPGYSGGPVVDRDGNVVAVSYWGGAHNNSAILAKDVLGVLDKAKRFEKEMITKRYDMGVKRSLGSVLERTDDGLVVTGLGIKAADGLLLKDRIVKINGKPLKTFTQLEEAMQSLDKDQPLELTVNSKGKDSDIKITPLTGLHSNKTAIAATIATNYWIQYHRRDGQSLQLVANNGSNGHSMLRNVQMTGKPVPTQPVNRPKMFSEEWFSPFVSVMESHRMSDRKAGIDSRDHNDISGFICHKRGFVLASSGTNAPKNGQFLVRMNSGREFVAHLVNKLPEFELMVLMLDDNTVTDWPTVDWGEPSALGLDDTVLSIGFDKCMDRDFVLNGTVIDRSIAGNDVNSIKALDRGLQYGVTNHRYIHHTSLIGNRPALINTAGQVVGITFHTYSYTDHIAVPIDNPLIVGLKGFMDTYNWEREGPLLGLVVYYLNDELRQVLSSKYPDVNAEGN